MTGQDLVTVGSTGSTGLIDAEKAKAIGRLDLSCNQARAAITEAAKQRNDFALAFTLAAGIKQIDAAMTPEMRQDIVRLCGNPYGFGKEADKKYDEPTIISCFIAATLQGARPVGDEWQILCSRPYLHWQPLRRKCESVGATNIKCTVYHHGEAKGGTAMVPVRLEYTIDGVQKVLDHFTATAGKDTRIPIRVNAGMGDEAIRAKARRQGYKRLWEHLSGSVLDDGDDDVTPQTLEGMVVEDSAPEQAALPAPSEPAKVDHLAIAMAKIDGGALKGAWAYAKQNCTDAEKSQVADRIEQLESDAQSRK